MRVIICGAGQVGYSIASYLAREENDVTVIDHNAKLIGQIKDDLDVNGIVGHASNPDVLSFAGAGDVDMMIAVTHSDEVNMVACQVGHSLFGVPKKIARIREQDYLNPAWSNLFSRAHMPIDVIISPEQVIAEDIFQRLQVPGTTFVISLAEGMAHIVGVVCREDCPIINTPLSQLRELFKDLSFKVIAILRNNKPIIPDDNEQIFAGDEVYFVADTKQLRRVMAVFGHEEKEARRIVISGGGSVGFSLAKLLVKQGLGTHIKILERNEQRAEYLSEQLENVVILRGNSLDRDILEEAMIEHVETLVAVTNDDESNILGSLLAKQYGCERVITLVNNNAYTPLIGPLGIDAMVSPRSTIVATIMQHVRRGRIHGLYNLRDGFAEVFEAEVSSSMALANKHIEDIEFPPHVILGAIIRDEEMWIPDAKDIVRAGDVLIILARQDQAKALERAFSVQVDLF
ncbi:MAG: Trk system potassium transporter TrkA [Alphaproteobacteria bacterium]